MFYTIEYEIIRKNVAEKIENKIDEYMAKYEEEPQIIFIDIFSLWSLINLNQHLKIEHKNIYKFKGIKLQPIESDGEFIICQTCEIDKCSIRTKQSIKLNIEKVKHPITGDVAISHIKEIYE